MIGTERLRRLMLLAGPACVVAAVMAAAGLPPVDTTPRAGRPHRDGKAGFAGNDAGARLPKIDRFAGPTFAAFQNGLTPQALRGKAIYQTGTSSSGGNITALTGSVETAATSLRCVNCHGPDGQGRPEGGIFPSALTWDALTKPYGSRLARGRTRPPYTEALLGRAIKMGLDCAGNLLNPAMPRYRLSSQDLADLLAYLQRIGSDADPGVTEDAIRIGVFLPPPSDFPDLNRTIRSALTSCFDEINNSGGIYQRKLDLRFSDAPKAPDERAAALRAFVERDQIFALLCTFMESAEKDLTGCVAEIGLPLVGPFTHDPELSFPLNRAVFHLHAGLSAQAETLAAIAARELPLGNHPCAVVFADENPLRDAAIAVQRRLARQGGTNIGLHAFARGRLDAVKLARQLSQSGTVAVFLFGCSREELNLLHQAQRLGWNPHVFIPGAVVDPGLVSAPLSFDGKIRL